MNQSRDIWNENKKIIIKNTSTLYWILWGALVTPVGILLYIYVRIGLVGGSFITPTHLTNVKKIYKDGSRGIRFYDKHTMII